MIDLTPLDVRNKRGDFQKALRGYDPLEVDVFLELVAERLEALVRENLQMRERTETLQQQVRSQLGREQAVQDALVTAQGLRADMKAQSQREAEHSLKVAETEARRLVAEAEADARTKVRDSERRIEGAGDTLRELERRRKRFLKDFRQLLEREFEVVDVEMGRTPLEDRTIDLDLGPSSTRAEPDANETVEESPEEVTAQTLSAESLEVDEEDARTPTESEQPTVDEAPSDGPTAAVEPPADELAASVEVDAFAEAQSQVVEVTGTGGDRLTEVPRLEEVLAEAGAEFAEMSPVDVSPMPQDVEEIAPPPITSRSDDTLLLYLDSDESER